MQPVPLNSDQTGSAAGRLPRCRSASTRSTQPAAWRGRGGGRIPLVVHRASGGAAAEGQTWILLFIGNVERQTNIQPYVTGGQLRSVSDFWSECAGPKLRLLGRTPSITVPTTWLIQYPLTFLADASGGSDLTRNSITGCPGPFRA